MFVTKCSLLRSFRIQKKYNLRENYKETEKPRELPLECRKVGHLRSNAHLWTASRLSLLINVINRVHLLPCPLCQSPNSVVHQAESSQASGHSR